MTLEYLEIMEDLKRKKCVKSFKSNTRVFDDDSIEVTPQENGSPALNRDFFGDDKGYTNIDKGRPSKGLMTPDFESIIPLLDAYVPKLDKKA